MDNRLRGTEKETTGYDPIDVTSPSALSSLATAPHARTVPPLLTKPCSFRTGKVTKPGRVGTRHASG